MAALGFEAEWIIHLALIWDIKRGIAEDNHVTSTDNYLAEYLLHCHFRTIFFIWFPGIL